MPSLSTFGASTTAWFEATFEGATPVQQLGWQLIARGGHGLLAAPTGSGKTLAAFLSAIDYCLHLGPDAAPGVRVLYVSPLKALVYDVERNLRAPLVGIRQRAEIMGLATRDVGVDVRTGDTPQKERQRQSKNPADILVTTPESLFLLLGSKARENLRTTHTIIVDEIHALAPGKRGTHLAVSLERLAELCPGDPQRIGLSATVRPIREVAAFLGGGREVDIVDLSQPPALDLQVQVPVPDMENVASMPRPSPGGSILAELHARGQSRESAPERGIWPTIYPRLLQQVRENRATIIFVNSRGLCERLTQRLNELAGEEIVRSHHGSVSHDQRRAIEEGLKQGQIKGIVATSSLELGIDMGAVDRVLLVESPGSVARGLQRVGRAGHQVGERSVGRIYPKFRGDLLECAVVAQRMLAGEIEALQIPLNPLDVLAQQIVAICCDRPSSVAEIAALVRRAYPFRQLSDELLHAVLEMLSGHYPSQDFADLRPLLAWDRNTDTLRPRRGAAMLSRLNAGTIPDRGNYVVTLGAEGTRLGELDEEMVFETRPGENILLGASTWRVEEITRDRVIVAPAPGEPGKLPFWRGDGPGRPIELGREVGAFVRRLGRMGRDKAVQWLQQEAHLDQYAAENLADYVHDQKTHTGTLPTDRAITVEHFRDELGDWRICILSPFGARVHAPWAMALQQQLAVASGFEIQVMYTDDGIVLRFADTDELPDLQALMPDPDELEELVTEQLAQTAMFAGLFRENAARSLLLPRRRADQRTPLWAQRLKSQNLLAAVRKYANFPIVLETYRQALADVFDIQALRQLLRDIAARRVTIDEVETPSASPFARSLVFAYVAAYIYEQDAPLAERKAQALTLDRGLLAELLGQDELRELIDPEVLRELEDELQMLADTRHARDADELHDMLRRLGDIGEAELERRVDGELQKWLVQLQREKRAVAVTLAGQRCWIAAEDAAVYRDALGVSPPAGLPDAYLAPVQSPMLQLAKRHAACHGPFAATELARRYGLTVAVVEPVLQLLAQDGALVHGEIRPGGVGADWCDAGVLRRLKRRTLARLRNAVAPVDAALLGMFLPRWHDIGGQRDGMDRLLEVVGQLQGIDLPWSTLQDTILPARVPGFNVDMLDMLAATGRVVWVGRGPLAARDGRVALFLRERVGDLLEPAADVDEVSPLGRAILDYLGRRGASFAFELDAPAREAVGDVNAGGIEDALWDLAWNGLITNDTFAPLRALRRPKSRRARGAPSGLASGRWALVDSLRATELSSTRRLLAWAEVLLDRYGVVSREVVAAENLGGGFSAIYRVLSNMEEGGRVRRGHFVDGLSGAQFARPGTIDRLRAIADAQQPPLDVDAGDIACLAAVDPANPWGSLLAWPATGGEDVKPANRPRRVAGAWVFLLQGRPLLYLGSSGRHLATFPASLADENTRLAAFTALRELPRRTRRRTLVIEAIDGTPAAASPMLPELLQCGFVTDYRGIAAEAFS